MRTKIIERCIRICNQVIINPKYRHNLKYVIEVLDQEIMKNNIKFSWKKIKNEKR